MGKTGDAMKPNRNDPCPCGSGRKTKHCCGERSQKKGRALPIIAMVVVAGLVIASVFAGSDEEKPFPARSAAPATTNAAATPQSQPAGAAPEGKVWSTEHGHWHDAPAVKIESSLQTGGENLTASVDTKLPVDGEERGGLVWNAAHNHWHEKDGAPGQPVPNAPINRHDIPRVTVGGGTATQGFNPVPQPPGPVPAGKVWSSIHGHWHDLDPQSAEQPATDTANQPQ